MAKTKNTPAYVKKAIEWLEKNAPDGEQIAFINEEEAAHLKARGGSGEEVVESVRSYQVFSFSPDPNSPKTVDHQRSDAMGRFLDRTGNYDPNSETFTSGPFRGQTRRQAASQV